MPKLQNKPFGRSAGRVVDALSRTRPISAPGPYVLDHLQRSATRWKDSRCAFEDRLSVFATAQPVTSACFVLGTY
jgi:hypothetical protein